MPNIHIHLQRPLRPIVTLHFTASIPSSVAWLCCGGLPPSFLFRPRPHCFRLTKRCTQQFNMPKITIFAIMNVLPTTERLQGSKQDAYSFFLIPQKIINYLPMIPSLSDGGKPRLLCS